MTSQIGVNYMCMLVRDLGSVVMSNCICVVTGVAPFILSDDCRHEF